MAVISDVLKGNLTTSVVALRTASNNSEHLVITFRNSSGSTRTVTIYENGTGTGDIKRTIELETLWSADVKMRLGNGDDVRAKQDSGSDVYWFIEEDILS